MGLPFRIVLHAPDLRSATNAAAAAFERIHELNQVLSDYDAESELTRLSRTAGSGRWVTVSPDLFRVLKRARDASMASDGAFDITVGPLVQQWRRARRVKELPPPAKIAEAKSAVGWQAVHLSHTRHAAKLDLPGMRLDLGGIAKGYALDEAHRVLSHLGIQSALVSGGGDLRVSDAPPGQPHWTIHVPGLDVEGQPGETSVALKNAALCTSGDLFQNVEIAGKRYSHIVDPRTGIGLTDHSLVTVIGRDGMTTDAISTALSVLSPEKRDRMIRKFPGVQARIVRIPSDRVESWQTTDWDRFKLR